jgi:polyphosphate glucokinase
MIGNTFYVVNDADAAGLAEMNYGSGKNKSGTVIIITLGTGIGSGLFLNGNLVQNTELGHVLYKKNVIFEKYAADSIRKRDGLTYSEWGERLNEYFKHIELILSPDLFIIGGGASSKISRFKNKIKIKTPVLPAKAKNNAGIIGAAVAAYQQIK